MGFLGLPLPLDLADKLADSWSVSFRKGAHDYVLWRSLLKSSFCKTPLNISARPSTYCEDYVSGSIVLTLDGLCR